MYKLVIFNIVYHILLIYCICCEFGLRQITIITDIDKLFETGRNKLSGVQAGFVILTPLSDTAPSEMLHTAHSGYTTVESTPSILKNVFSAIKNVFSAAPTAHAEETLLTHHPPPPIQPIPPFQPMSWGAVDSYGLPAATDAYSSYDPHNPHPPFDYATSKTSVIPTKHISFAHSQGLNSKKLQKINHNLDKLNVYLHDTQRSSEVVTNFNGLEAYRNLLQGNLQVPTPVVTDNDIGVLPADLLPDSATTMTATTTTTEKSTTESAATGEEKKRDRKDLKYYLRGNKIIVQG